MTLSRLSRPKNRDLTNPISAVGAPSRRSLAFSNSSWSRRLKVGMTFSLLRLRTAAEAAPTARCWQLREQLPFPGGLWRLHHLQLSLCRRLDAWFRRACAGHLLL